MEKEDIWEGYTARKITGKKDWGRLIWEKVYKKTSERVNWNKGYGKREYIRRKGYGMKEDGW